MDFYFPNTYGQMDRNLCIVINTSIRTFNLFSCPKPISKYSRRVTGHSVFVYYLNKDCTGCYYPGWRA